LKGFQKGNQLQKDYWLGKHHSEETKQKLRKILRGKKRSEESIQRMKAAKSGEKNPAWKGNSVGRFALHNWVRKNSPKPELCEICNIKPPYDLANISPKYNPETYTRDIKNWRWLCRRCHVISDGRVKNFTQLSCPYCGKDLND
jgi:NUMOD3 motif-containing protein